MNEAAILMLLKIVSDILMIVTLGTPSTGSMSDEEKKALLKSEQEKTAQLIADLMAMAKS